MEVQAEGVLEVEEATLGEVVGIMRVIPVEDGGGSYNTGKNQQNECCYKTAGHGQVTITLI